jgi:hypothetical protein
MLAAASAVRGDWSGPPAAVVLVVGSGGSGAVVVGAAVVGAAVVGAAVVDAAVAGGLTSTRAGAPRVTGGGGVVVGGGGAVVVVGGRCRRWWCSVVEVVDACSVVVVGRLVVVVVGRAVVVVVACSVVVVVGSSSWPEALAMPTFSARAVAASDSRSQAVSRWWEGVRRDMAGSS